MQRIAAAECRENAIYPSFFRLLSFPFALRARLRICSLNARSILQPLHLSPFFPRLHNQFPCRRRHFTPALDILYLQFTL